MAADPRDLTTLADVRAWLGLKDTDTASDAILQRLITAASGYMQAWMNRQIASQQYTEVRDGTGKLRMSFADYPVTAVSSVVVDNVSIQPYTVQSPLGYVFSPTMIYLRGGSYEFTKDFQNITLQYTAGFTEIPYELAEACIEMVSLKFKNLRLDRLGVSSKTPANETIVFTQNDFTASIQTILSNYKKVIPL